jgi:cellulose synthase/poly-beta-1,6-N-acetylglucosamine synthase-like glycosyltransferase
LLQLPAILQTEMSHFQTIATLVFWLCTALLLYVYLGYPPLLAIIASLFPKRKPAPDYFPSLSILIAAYNEEASIARKIEQTLALDYPKDKLEILVLSDGSTDRTDEIVKSFHDDPVRLLRIEGRKGKTHAQNESVKAARGEVLVFSDATTVYEREALRYLAANYSDPKVGAVSGRYEYVDPTGISPTGQGQISFWSYENNIKMLQSRIRTVSGCCGCIYSLRRELYTELPGDVISDLTQALCVIRQGYRVAFEDRALAFEETTTSSTDEFKMRIRVVTRGMRGVLSVPELLVPWKYPWISFQLISHKILRWLVPFFLVLSFVSNALLLQTSFFRAAFSVQLAFYLLTGAAAALPLRKVWKPLNMPLYFCTLNFAALVSVLDLLRGRKYVLWETVRTPQG